MLGYMVVGCLVCLLLLAHAAGDGPLADKTLVVWAAPADLEQGGGSALTLDRRDGTFDAIVFAELGPRRWMAGSNGFVRTQRQQDAWPEETVTGRPVQIAIVYRGQQVEIYRDGQTYAVYTMANPPETFGPDAVVMFGKRHLDGGTPQECFRGTISDARICDRALDQAAIAALTPGDTADTKPWAWWYFVGGYIQERTGRYAETRVVGDVRADVGGLVLGGDGAMLVAQPKAWADREPAPWRHGDAVPRSAIESTRALREHLLADRYRPGYHFAFPEDNGSPGDPNGALLWNGRYHLMYLFNDGRAPVWGHASSKDLVHWRYHPVALGPGQGDSGIFSGGAFIDKDGVATISYWGLAEGPGQGICIARSTDEHLDTWAKSPANPVIRSTHFGYTVAQGADGEAIVYGSADPSNIWINDGRYYMLTGNLLVLNKYGTELGQVEHQGDTAYLFTSDDLTTWEYLHPFYQSDRKWTHKGEDNMCPVFLPLPSSPDGGPPSERHLLLFISHCDGCQYYVGRYEDDRFVPETHGRMTWVDNAYFAPEALLDARGRLIMWAWLLDNPPQPVTDAQGWHGVYGLPRELWLRQDGTLGMRAVEELQMLRQEQQSLEEARGDMLELELAVRPSGATQCGVAVCRSADGREETLVYYDAAAKTLNIDTTRSSLGFGRKVIESAPFELAQGEKLTLRVFVDRSVVEVYANERQAVARRVYPTLEGTGVKLFSQGEGPEVISARAWEMMPSNAF